MVQTEHGCFLSHLANATKQNFERIFKPQFLHLTVWLRVHQVLAFWNQNLTELDNLQIGYNSYCWNYQSTYTNLVLVDTNTSFRYSIASGEDILSMSLLLSSLFDYVTFI